MKQPDVNSPAEVNGPGALYFILKHLGVTQSRPNPLDGNGWLVSNNPGNQKIKVTIEACDQNGTEITLEENGKTMRYSLHNNPFLGAESFSDAGSIEIINDEGLKYIRALYSNGYRFVPSENSE